MANNTWWQNLAIGLAVIGPVFIGLISTVLAAFLILSGDFTEAALCLIAAGVSFGFLASAVFGPSS
jgi:hypothetical protein